ncbi:MAG: hypothetical protein QW497_05815 [Candidatus Bathyarchaeia archaeon]
MVNYALLNKVFLMVFVVIAVAAICLSLVFGMQNVAIVLWLLNFIVAFMVAVFGSLRIRTEEEEKMLK